MAKTTLISIGGREVALKQSATMIAVKPAPGLRRSLERTIGRIDDGRPVARRGALGGFDLIDIKAPAARVARGRRMLNKAAAVSEATPVYHTSKDEVPFVPQGTIYLAFEPGLSQKRRQDIVARHGLSLVRQERGGAMTVRLNQQLTSAVDAAAALQREAGVRVAEPDLITPRLPMQFEPPSDTLLPRLWHLDNKGAHGGTAIGFKKGADARLVAAWTLLQSLGSPEAVIGIIDDGFDLAHPDLAGKAISPWDFSRNTGDVSPMPDPDAPRQGDWHGTACCGVACGGPGEGQMIGAAPLARIIPVRFGNALIPDEIARCFDHMTDKGAWVVSSSWGAEAAVYPLPTRVSDAIARCARDGRGGKGAAIVFAAGNHKKDINSANYYNGFALHPDAIAVSASTSVDTRADYSNFGEEIWVCAPSGGSGGWDVITTDVDGTYVDSAGMTRPMGYQPGAYFDHFTGTSCACPLVAGIAALVMGANPGLSAAQVKDILKTTARRIGRAQDYDTRGHSRHFGYGCVNAEAAVREALNRGGIS